MRIAGLVALVSLFALVPVAGAAPLAQAADSLDAADQPLVNGGITVLSVNASKDGWVTVHLDEGGSPGAVLGHSPIKAGANANVKVQLERDIPVGGKIWPMLHVDAGSIGVYEFPGPDAPVVVNNNIIMKQITITEAAAPAALPRTGGADGAAALLIGALAILIAGGLLRFRRA
jgi:LPXTG-motif cell wall-anchored protein